jgi:hypothetical protein
VDFIETHLFVETLEHDFAAVAVNVARRGLQAA